MWTWVSWFPSDFFLHLLQKWNKILQNHPTQQKNTEYWLHQGKSPTSLLFFIQHQAHQGNGIASIMLVPLPVLQL